MYLLLLNIALGIVNGYLGYAHNSIPHLIISAVLFLVCAIAYL